MADSPCHRKQNENINIFIQSSRIAPSMSRIEYDWNAKIENRFYYFSVTWRIHCVASNLSRRTVKFGSTVSRASSSTYHYYYVCFIHSMNFKQMLMMQNFIGISRQQQQQQCTVALISQWLKVEWDYYAAQWVQLHWNTHTQRRIQKWLWSRRNRSWTGTEVWRAIAVYIEDGSIPPTHK